MGLAMNERQIGIDPVTLPAYRRFGKPGLAVFFIWMAIRGLARNGPARNGPFGTYATPPPGVPLWRLAVAIFFLQMAIRSLWMKTLSKRKRSEIARKAAQAHWAKRKD